MSGGKSDNLKQGRSASPPVRQSDYENAANWRNRTLFHGDNLAFLRAMNSESVHLIATTCVVAEQHRRQWAGIDIWDKAHKTVVDRLKSTTGLFGEVHYQTDLPERTDEC